MRRLILSMMMSIDGFIEGPNRDLDWHLVDDELHTYINDLARGLGAFLYGRRTYELMVDYWPTADRRPSSPAYEVEFARIWKDTPKIVFSTTLGEVQWNTTLIRENVAEEVTRLKGQPGGSLMLYGGAAMASMFMRLGFIDEYQLYLHPVVLGSGTPLFPTLDGGIKLKLVEARTFRTGVVLLRYQRADEP